MSEPVAWNRAERRRRGMTRSRMKRTGSLASAGVLVSAGLFGAYVGNPRLQRAYASPAVCSGAVPVTGPGDDTLVAALDDSTVTCIEIQGEITLSADLPVITDDSWTGGPRDGTWGLTLYGAGGDDTINGYDGADNHGGLAILLDDTPVDTVRLSLSGLTMANLQARSASGVGGAVLIGVQHGAAAVSVCGSYFADNTAEKGGAIYANSIRPGTLRINDPGCPSGRTTFARNTATGPDGGGAIFTGLDADIYDAHFTGNTATHVGSPAQGGGAIAGANSFDDTLSVRVFESTFTDDTSAGDGGAISLLASGSDTTYLYLKDDTFSGSEAASLGGAIRQRGASPQTVIQGSTFTNNIANSGGAIYTDGLVRIDAPGGGPDPTVFSVNTAATADGGAIFAYDGVKAYDGVVFTGNSSVDEGGAIYAYGRVDVSGVTFTGNSSGSKGGAIFGNYSVYADNGTQFLNNEANDGGAISANDRVDVSGVTFTGNSSEDVGGAIAGDSVYADNGAQFLDNSARNRGGAIIAYRAGLDRVLIEGNAAHQFGGGVAVMNGLLTVSNSTIYGNSAGLEGGGIWSDDSVTVSYSAIIGNRAVDDTNGTGVGGGIAAMGIHSEVLLTNSYVGGNQADDTAGGIFLPGSHSHLGLYFSTVYDDSSANSAFPSGIMVAGALTAVGSAVGNSFGTLPWFAAYSVDDTYFVSSHLPGGGWTPGSGSVELGPGVGLGLGVRDDTVTPGHAGRTPLAGSPLVAGAPSSSFGVLPADEDQLGVSRVAPFTIGARQFVAPAPPPPPPPPPPGPDPTPTPTPTPTPAPVPVPPPGPGGSQLLVDGVPVPGLMVDPNAGRDGLDVSGPGFSMTLAGVGPDGQALPLADDSVLQVVPGAQADAGGTGFKPGTQVGLFVDPPAGGVVASLVARVLSGPVTLGLLPVGADGTFAGSVPVPADLALGGHVLQAVGFSPSGQTRAVSLGVVAVEARKSILVTGTREGRRVKVQGATQGLTASTVVPRYHFAGQLKYKTGIARPTIDASGNFRWSRTTGRTIYLYFAADKTHSNRLILRRDR